MFWTTVVLYAGIAATTYINVTPDTHDVRWWAGLVLSVLIAVKAKLSPNAGQSESDATKKPAAQDAKQE